ncbi:MAG: glycoside hydrolase family 9 protein [Bacteroides sp.]|nr:glycoside hydrolase family 9 protein [Bacteroides sp.]
MRFNHLLCLATLFLLTARLHAEEWIRINQLGYLPLSVKVAVFMSEEGNSPTEYALVDAFTGKTVRSYSSPRPTGALGQMKTTYRLDFSDFDQPGTYYLKASHAESPRFVINHHVYDHTADFLLNYMRQQRCGYNPYLKDSCHTHDGYIVYHPTKTGQKIDVRGGWHDATDYLQYTTTSANAIYQMMFAYLKNPEAFTDAYDADGHPGANGIPDIVDEIKWGLDWLNRMNPEKGEMYNQIADDRDHAGMRLPQHDEVDYGYGPGNGRPVYFCSGEKQQRGDFLNASTGVASTAGKFASCFALGARILKDFYPEFAAEIAAKADDAYQEGIKKPGICQTASVKSPYIYEEDNWVDDMELAAIELFRASGNETYLQQAIEYGRQEPVTPWMGADSARHYQWYPFMNMGHYWIAREGNERVQKEFIRNMRTGIQCTYEKAIESPFMHGIPYIWCSNNLTTAMLTQCSLYRELTGDDTYAEMEATMRDWLFGCNPWGTSMVVELPLYGNYPKQPHSSILVAGLGNTTGGLVDGPVYTNIFKSLRGVSLEGGEAYEKFQPGLMVYHDGINDYSTNEPTMDGTACLTYYLSALQKEGMIQAGKGKDKNVYHQGGIIRSNPDVKQISLVFTAADKADGAETILKVLRQNQIQGAFFLTGDFYRMFPEVVQQLRSEGHYVGAHSDKHPLYCSWKDPSETLISREEFEKDLLENYRLMREAGIPYTDAPLFMPPYEHYNREISSWTRTLGLQLVNFTAGTLTNADYTTPDMPNYRSSKEIYDKVMAIEKAEGLNGHIMLIHLGTDDKRTDKFYNTYLDKVIKSLKKKGYAFNSLRDAVGM